MSVITFFFFSVGTAQLGRCKEETLQITEMPHCLGVDVEHRVSGGAVVSGFSHGAWRCYDQ